MKACLAPLAFGLLACAPQFDCDSANGVVTEAFSICLLANGFDVDAEEIDLAAALLVEEVAKRHPEDVGSAKSFRDAINDHGIAIFFAEPDGDDIVGSRRGYNITLEKRGESLAETCVIHEMIHSFTKMVGVDTDDHDYKDYLHETSELVHPEWIDVTVAERLCDELGVDYCEFGHD